MAPKPVDDLPHGAVTPTPDSPIPDTPPTPTSPTSSSDDTSPSSPPGAPYPRSLTREIDFCNHPFYLIDILNSIPFTNTSINYPERLVHAAGLRENFPGRIPIIYMRVQDTSPSPAAAAAALLGALSAASRTLNTQGAEVLFQLGADPWSDAALEGPGEWGGHPLVLAARQTFPAYPGDRNPLISVLLTHGRHVARIPKPLAAGAGAAAVKAWRAERVEVWRREVGAIAAYVKYMVVGLLFKGLEAGGGGREAFRAVMREAQEEYLATVRRMLFKAVVAMGVPSGVVDERAAPRKGARRGDCVHRELVGVWWVRGLTAAGLRKRLREEGMLVDEKLVYVWEEMVRVAGGVMVKTPAKKKVEGEMGLYVLLVEGQF
ncbi:hypothetical protein QBC39DRAFT_370930 [Podospora conica]|nr:hypothetical protein QBC39DRAFT_370930 [Schizothecium conicum]